MDESKLARVRGLLAKAASTEFPEEADALNKKAVDLMALYGIEDAHLAASGARADAIGQLKIVMDDAPYSSEKFSLLSSIARSLRCKAIGFHTPGGRTVNYAVVMGYQSDLQRVELLYTSLLLQAVAQVGHQYPDRTAFGGGASTTGHRRAWFLGFARAVGARLRDVERRAAADAAETEHRTASTRGGKSTELVLIDRVTRVEAAFEEAFPDSKSVRRRGVDSDGYSSGRAAGRRADIGQPRLGGHRGALRG